MSLLLLHSKLVFSHYVLIAWATWSLNHPPSCNLRHNKHFEITGLSPFCVHLLKISSINIYLLLIIVKDRKIVSISTRTYWVFVLFFLEEEKSTLQFTNTDLAKSLLITSLDCTSRSGPTCIWFNTQCKYDNLPYTFITSLNFSGLVTVLLNFTQVLEK